MKHRGLGRGLSSLLGEETMMSVGEKDAMRLIDLRYLEAGQYQPRKNFDQAALHELASSVREHGIMQPIVVHPLEGERYAIIAGERRFRAAHLAGLEVIPAIEKEISREKVLELALVENVQRENLNAMEEAEGYARLMDEFDYRQEDIAKIVGKSRSHIANLLRLNNLPETIKNYISDNTLSMAHGRLLVGHPMSEDLASIMIEKGLSVRQSESLVKYWGNKESSKKSKSRFPGYNDIEDSQLQELTNVLADKFGMKVSIENDGGQGRVIFHYSNLEQLDAILNKLTTKEIK